MRTGLRAALRTAVGLTGLLTGCAVGPDYHRPSAEIPPAWQPTAPWQEAVPGDTLLKGKWWELFQDPQLNPLVEQALGSNQNLRVAAARLEQARDQLTIARSALFPSIDLAASASRSKNSSNRALAGYSFSSQSTVQNDFRIGPGVNWEIDLFGRVRRQVEGDHASAQQAQADLENTRVTLIAELATDYFSLRELDDEIEVGRTRLQLVRGPLAFASARHELGFATALALAQQQALLDSGATQLDLLQNQRAQ